MTKQTVRSIAAIFVLITTIVVFVLYFYNHPEIFRSLQTVPLSTLLLVLGLYAVFQATLVWIQRATLGLCGLTLKKKESALLVMYSSIINFFGPLQSGPAFRAAYLKTKHNINLKKYTLATLMYYGLYALFSGVLLLSFFVGWWIGVLAALGFAAAPLVLKIPRFRVLDVRNFLQLSMATFSQVAMMCIIYFVELRAFVPQIKVLSSFAYTGAANLALFVSITPGAIGFRESFLLVSQKLHSMSNATIAAASVIDRSVYVLMLLIMAALIFGLHANDRFKLRTPRPESK